MGDIENIKVMKELSEEFTITTNLRDCYDNLKMSSVLDLTQEIATHHANILNVGFDDFIVKNYIRVIVRNRFDIVGDIYNLSKVKIKTYPLKNNLMEYPRDYEIYNEKDELIIKGRSIWMVYDFVKKSIATPHLEIYDEGRVGVFNERLKRLPKPIKSSEHYIKDIVVRKSLLDHNMHLNNSHCVDLFLDLFNPDKETKIKSFHVEYVSQCYLNDRLSVYKYHNLNNFYIYIYKDDELKIYFEVITN